MRTRHGVGLDWTLEPDTLVPYPMSVLLTGTRFHLRLLPLGEIAFLDHLLSSGVCDSPGPERGKMEVSGQGFFRGTDMAGPASVRCPHPAPRLFEHRQRVQGSAAGCGGEPAGKRRGEGLAPWEGPGPLQQP